MGANIRVLISYSWDDEDHKKWVLALADRLRGDGVDIILDQYELSIGSNLDHFIETSVSSADKVIIILTPNYAIKANSRIGGVGAEYSIITNEFKNDVSVQVKKYLPVLRSGDFIQSVPTFLKPLISHNMCEDKLFENQYEELLRAIYEKPKVIKPPLGDIPDL